MRFEALFLLVIAVFFAVCAVVFWAIGLAPIYRTITGGGTVMLVACALLGTLPGSYYLWWSRRMTPRPEDDSNATLEQGAGVVGTFPSSSIWPFVLGFGAFFVCLALVFGFWSAIVGFVLGIAAVIGVIVESRHGGSPA